MVRNRKEAQKKRNDTVQQGGMFASCLYSLINKQVLNINYVQCVGVTKMKEISLFLSRDL